MWCPPDRHLGDRFVLRIVCRVPSWRASAWEVDVLRKLGAACLAHALGLVMLVLVSVDPAGAKVLKGSDVGPYEFSYGDCGFSVDVDGLFSSPKSMARVGTGDRASAFFGHDNYTLTETHTRRDTGAVLVIVVHGLLREVRATLVNGSIFEFTMLDVPHVEFRDADGVRLGRENGQIRRVFLFDTLGDDTPGGVFLESLSEDFRGHFGRFDICSAFGDP